MSNPGSWKLRKMLWNTEFYFIQREVQPLPSLPGGLSLGPWNFIPDRNDFVLATRLSNNVIYDECFGPCGLGSTSGRTRD